MTDFRDLNIQSNSEIVAICNSAPRLAGSPHGNQVVKITEDLVVKFGMGVKRQEAVNQTYVHRYVDNTILYVPQVFHFFEATLWGLEMGFIVMEYVHGTRFDTLDVLNDPNLAKRTIDAIRHLATIPLLPSQGPGPVGGGSAEGYLWSDDGTGCTFKTIDDMEDWMNKRLDVANLPYISFAHHQKITMRHMDLVRRNIYLRSDSSICFLDWAFAGFYPEIFETHVFRELLYKDDVWFTQLLRLSPKPDINDEQVLQYLGIPAVVNNKYSLNHERSSGDHAHSNITPPPTLPPFPNNIS